MGASQQEVASSRPEADKWLLPGVGGSMGLQGESRSGMDMGCMRGKWIEMVILSLFVLIPFHGHSHCNFWLYLFTFFFNLLPPPNISISWFWQEESIILPAHCYFSPKCLVYSTWFKLFLFLWFSLHFIFLFSFLTLGGGGTQPKIRIAFW